GLMDGWDLFGHFFPTAAQSVSGPADLYVLSVSLLLCLCAGFLTTNKTEYIAHGLQSGLYVGIVSGVISVPVSWFLDYSINSDGVFFVRRQVFAFVLETGCGYGIYIILALCAGALGGKIARLCLMRT